jgi:S-adenosylmethionine:tRNA ribosyltransferase-isomerase
MKIPEKLSQVEALNFDKILTEEYNYELPETQIAKFPAAQRDTSKLLIYKEGEIAQDVFKNLSDYLSEEDFMVFNETKVIKARLNFRKSTGAKIEVFCLEPHLPADYEQAFQAGSGCVWKCAVGNLKKWKSGYIYSEAEHKGKPIEIRAEKIHRNENTVLVKFHWDNAEIHFGDILEQAGKTPIPPYLNRESNSEDSQNYQTVYSRIKGSVAAPTAGLHFTPEVLNKLKQKGVESAFVNLHVGAGTFKPVTSETAGGHNMHSELFSVELEQLRQIARNAGRIAAVGTTSVRTLESLYWFGVKAILKSENMDFLSQTEINDLPQNISVANALEALIAYAEKSGTDAFKASTQIFIIPGYQFRTLHKMITNFHLPKSTLLMLIAAFTGNDWKSIYHYALQNNFRFLSYGDSSLLIPKNTK